MSIEQGPGPGPEENTFEAISDQNIEKPLSPDNKEAEAMEKVRPIFDTPGMMYHYTGITELAPIVVKGVFSHEFAKRAKHTLADNTNPLVQERFGMQYISCWDPYKAINNRRLWLKGEETIGNTTRLDPPEFVSEYGKREKTPWRQRVWQSSYKERVDYITTGNTETAFEKEEEVADALRNGCYRPLYDMKPMVLIDPKVERMPARTYFGTEVLVKNRIRPENIVGVAMPEHSQNRRARFIMQELLDKDYLAYMRLAEETINKNVDEDVDEETRKKGKELAKKIGYPHGLPAIGGWQASGIPPDFKYAVVKNFDRIKFLFDPQEIEELKPLTDHLKPVSNSSYEDEYYNRHRAKNIPEDATIKALELAEQVQAKLAGKIKEVTGKDIEDLSQLDLVKAICAKRGIPVYLISDPKDQDKFNYQGNGRLVWPQELNYDEVKNLTQGKTMKSSSEERKK